MHAELPQAAPQPPHTRFPCALQSARPAAAAAVDYDAVVASLDKSYYDTKFDPVAELVVRAALRHLGARGLLYC